MPANLQGLNVATISQILAQIIDCFQIAVCSMARNSFHTSKPDEAYLPEILPLLYFGDMNFHSGDANCFYCIQNGNAGMGIGTGIDDNTIHDPICLLNFVYQITLMVGLEKFHLDSPLFSVVADQIAKVKEVKQARKPKKARKSNRESIEAQLDRLDDVYIRSTRMTAEKYEQKKAAILAKLIPEDEPEEKLPELADLGKIQAMFDRGVEELYKEFTPEERREFWRGILTEVQIDRDRIAGVDFIE